MAEDKQTPPAQNPQVGVPTGNVDGTSQPPREPPKTPEQNTLDDHADNELDPATEAKRERERKAREADEQASAVDMLSGREPNPNRGNPTEPSYEFAPETVGRNHDAIDLVVYISNEFGMTNDNAREVLVNLRGIQIDGEPYNGDPRSIPITEIAGKTVTVDSSFRAVKFKYPNN